MDKYQIVQTIQEPTRKKNTLDLVFVNDISIFTQIEVTKTIMSDHDLIEITTNIEEKEKHLTSKENTDAMEENDLRQLNFHSEKVPWSLIKQIIKELDWHGIFKGRNNEECTHIFMEIIKKICNEVVPRKISKHKSKIPRDRKKLLNRLKMLKRKKHCANNRNDKQRIQKNIIETEMKLSEHRNQERSMNEKRVIENMKDKPKILFDYIRRQKDKDRKISPLKMSLPH